MTYNFTLCWSSGQTRVYYNEPKTPIAHWPFRQQTIERFEVSPEVILMGWPKTHVSRSGSVASYVRLAALLGLRDIYLCAVMRNFLLLAMIPTSIASPRPGQHLTLSYAQSSTRGIAHHSSSDGAISPPCDILPLRLSVLSLLEFNLQDTIHKAVYNATLNCLKWNLHKSLYRIPKDFNLHLSL